VCCREVCLATPQLGLCFRSCGAYSKGAEGYNTVRACAFSFVTRVCARVIAPIVFLPHSGLEGLDPSQSCLVCRITLLPLPEELVSTPPKARYVCCAAGCGDGSLVITAQRVNT
jgi:hypothetical protein